jgi:glycosyltransferase involved in cell wall biosynthesis
MITSSPIISIISASYNSKQTIESTILSVIPHLSNSCEYIIIDGGSTDGSIEIINKYKNYLSYFVSEKDNGIYHAWNKGILKAQGEYVAFIGMDDLLCANYSSVYLKSILMNPEVDFWSSKMLIRGENKKNIIFGKHWEWHSFRRSMKVVHPGSLHKINLFNIYGLYNENYKIVGDYEFLLRIKSNLKSGFINKTTVVFSLNGVSNNNPYLLAKEIRNAKLNTKARSILMTNLEFIFRICIGFFHNLKAR